uniref:Uncharacterized protein n=1 Tax=Coccidioides posadasii RMSCC 3488 TaxID=454284 RepID=A0A0J6F9K4_COCPO|nr:hypothetical protein CPAG_03234 [Coccidioides posadasii RMSCC 3488]
MAFGPGLHTIHRMRTLLSVMADRPAPPLEGNVLDDEVNYFSFDVYRDFGGMEVLWRMGMSGVADSARSGAPTIWGQQ